MSTIVPKLSSGGAVKIRFTSLDLGTTRWREGTFEILEKDNKVNLCLRFNCGGASKTFQLNQNVKNINQNLNRIILNLKDSSVITLDKVPVALAQKTKEYLEKLKQGKPDQPMPGPSSAMETEDTTPFHFQPPASEPSQSSDMLAPSMHVNSEEIDQLLYMEQQKQTTAQEKHASQLKGLTGELRATRQQLRPIASSSRQLVSALAGLNRNLVGLRSDMQASHREIMGVMDRIAAALEAKALVVSPKSQPEENVSRGRGGKGM